MGALRRLTADLSAMGGQPAARHEDNLTMRKLTAGLFHSVDGVVEAPDQWQFDAFDAELGTALGAVMQTTDTVLMGRVGYEQWAGYWPEATTDNEFADFINTVPKFVASRTLRPGQLGWQNTTLRGRSRLSCVN